MVPGKYERKELSDEEKLEMESVPYGEAVGMLLYISTRTRPDIGYATNEVARHLHCPTPNDWKNAKRIMRYLKGTKLMKLVLGGSIGDRKLVGYADADYASTPDGKSITGYAFIMGIGAITWSTRKQQTPALSTCEAEYMSLSAATQESIWISKIMKDYREKCGSMITILIYQDNQGAIALAKASGSHSRTKHINVRHHFIRDALKKRMIEIKYCPTDNMVADTCTKPLARDKFEKYRAMLGVKDYRLKGIVKARCLDSHQ
jgi:hypothetical protein